LKGYLFDFRSHPAKGATESLTKAAIQAALLHDGVCSVAGFDLSVYGNIPLCDRAVPNIMVSLPMPDEGAAVPGQLIPNNFLVFSHYVAILSQRSDTIRSWIGVRAEPFSASSSGTANRKRSMSASNDPDSSTRPGTSSLSAIQTQESGSHVSLINNSIVASFALGFGLGRFLFCSNYGCLL
jgi:hypothetical protein